MTSQTETTPNPKEIVGPHDLDADTRIPDVAPLARNGTRRTAAEEARTIVAQTTTGTLATLSDDGTPWASLVTYGIMADGSPVLCLSTLAEHARNVERDQRASLMVADPHHAGEILAGGRVTLAGRVRRSTDHPDGGAAREAHIAAIPSAAMYADFNDFTFWILEVERVRWVGGYGRMDSASAADYSAALPDPVAPNVPDAISHLNSDHADALLVMARALSKHADSTAAECVEIDRYGLDLNLDTPAGPRSTRIDFDRTVETPDGLRAATVELTRRAQETLGSR